MSLKKEIKEALEKYNLQPKKYFGQNFLIEKGTLKKVIETAELRKTDFVLEVGPGLGFLTKELAKKVKKVIAIEKDKELFGILNNRLRIMKINNAKIIEGDILKTEFQNTNDKLQTSSKNQIVKIPKNYKVVANLPYYITSPVIRKFLEEKNQPSSMVLMVQKEVAQRICAKPPKMTLLSVAVQLYAEPRIIKTVKKDNFWPKPGVDSAILQIAPRRNTKKYAEPREKNSFQFRDQFFKIAKAGFSSKRKQLKNNFKSVLGNKTEKILKDADIDNTRRAESLFVEDWIKITNLLLKKQKSNKII